MIFTRFQFFLLLFAILIGPFLLYKIWWLADSTKTNGTMFFVGHTLELNGSISSHIVILFKAGKDSITINTVSDLPYQIGNQIPIRYQKDNPLDARVDLPARIWGDTFADTLAQLLILIVLFLTPDQLDPLLPRKSKIVIGRRPLIKILKE